MDKERIEFLVREGRLRKRSIDTPRIKSLLASATENSSAVRKIRITDETATLVFREFYENIRQLGDAKWWSLGYEAMNHDVSMEILKEMNIRESLRLHNINRFRRTRNNANYRGYKVTKEQAMEIADFWDACGEDMIQKIKAYLRDRKI
jgi:hypothetical protein